MDLNGGDSGRSVGRVFSMTIYFLDGKGIL
jgi:hypothetical protein